MIWADVSTVNRLLRDGMPVDVSWSEPHFDAFFDFDLLIDKFSALSLKVD